MKKYFVNAVVLFIGILIGIIAATNYTSYQAVEIDFMNDSAKLLVPLMDDYRLIEKGVSQTDEEFRKAVLCHVLRQRKTVAAVMRLYDDSLLREEERGNELLGSRDYMLDEANSLTPEGVSADEYFDRECKAYHR